MLRYIIIDGGEKTRRTKRGKIGQMLKAGTNLRHLIPMFIVLSVSKYEEII